MLVKSDNKLIINFSFPADKLFIDKTVISVLTTPCPSRRQTYCNLLYFYWLTKRILNKLLTFLHM